MSIVALIAILAIVGIIFWYIQKLSLPQPIMLVVYAVIAIVAILFLLQFVGGVPSLRLR